MKKKDFINARISIIQSRIVSTVQERNGLPQNDAENRFILADIISELQAELVYKKNKAANAG